MDVLQSFVDDYNARAHPAIQLGSAGEAGGAQLRLRYSPAEGQVSIFHMVAVDGDHVEDRDLTLGGAVTQPQLRAPRFARGAELDRRMGAGVVVVHEGLEHVHRVLLRSLVGRASRPSLLGVRSRSTIAPACPLSSSW